MFCVKCGTKNDDSSKFCIKCGEQVTVNPLPVQSVQSPVGYHEPTPQYSQNPYMQPSVNKPPVSPKKFNILALVIPIAGVVFILAIFMILFFATDIFRSNISSPPNDGIINNGGNNGNSNGDPADALYTLYGDGYTLEYDTSIWSVVLEENINGDYIDGLEYLVDGTTLAGVGISGMLGHSTATLDERDDMFQMFNDIYHNSFRDSNAYIETELGTFVILKDDIYYTTFNIVIDDTPVYKIYVITSEQNDIVVSFLATFPSSSLLKYSPDSRIMPILQSISFTNSSTHQSDDGYDFSNYIYRVWHLLEEYVVCDESIPSMYSIMFENDIEGIIGDVDKVVGRMILPTIFAFLPGYEEDKVLVEIVETTYENVDDVWGAIDIFGRLLNDEYGFYVTYPPTDYSNFGPDYRFCELIKELDNGEGIFYVAAIYSRDEGIIITQVGIIEAPMTNEGIGPLNLEAIARG